MAPNGYDHPEDVNDQISSFKEIMTLALQAVPGLTFGCGTDTGESTLLQIMPDLASALQHCPDVPEKAKLFVEKFCEVANAFGIGDNVEGMNEEYDVEHALNDIAKLEISLDELVQVSQGNSALETVSKKVRDEALALITLMKGALAQEDTTHAAAASLDELYSTQKKNHRKKTRVRKPRKAAAK